MSLTGQLLAGVLQGELPVDQRIQNGIYGVDVVILVIRVVSMLPHVDGK